MLDIGFKFGPKGGKASMPMADVSLGGKPSAEMERALTEMSKQRAQQADQSGGQQTRQSQNAVENMAKMVGGMPVIGGAPVQEETPSSTKGPMTARDLANMMKMRGPTIGFKKGGVVSAKKATTTKQSSASKRADGIAQRGKTRGRFV